jgi:prevent-host-death family protein
MTIFNIHEAKTHFSKLLERVLRGEEVVIAKAGKPIARLMPFMPNDMAPRKPGKDKGKVVIGPDFEAPLPEFEE